jgi:regulator of replication initiation timing
MSTINALAHHIDQLLTQHRTLQHEHAQLQISMSVLEQELLQQQAENTLAKEQSRPTEQLSNQALEDDLNHLISLFDQATDAHHE